MKTIRKKMASHESATWPEWSGLLLAKLVGLSVALAALGGMGMLTFAAAESISQHGLWPVLLIAATMWAFAEGTPVLAKKAHDRALQIIERVFNAIEDI